MATAGLLALLDDIATVLDDVSTMTKVAAKKTSAVLGDDLALNAQQVSGVRAERELPIVWEVAVGSLKNKVILVPAALLISALVPWLIVPLLMLGGAYLCFEGFEAVHHKLFHKDTDHKELHEALLDPSVDMRTFEKDKIKGAIRTDFILSAEIIVIALGTAQGAGLMTQALVVSGIALAMTVGVYSLVAGIVKLDDGAMLLMASETKGAWGNFKRGFGDRLLSFCPKFMHGLSVVGTAAMFLVGGGILVHGIPALHHWVNHSAEVADGLPAVGQIISTLTPTLLNGLVGVLAGGLLVAVMGMVSRIRQH